MAITAYTGLPGSGKTYEVVSSVILPALAAGRRVVSNIDGLDSDRLRSYVSSAFSVPLESCGTLVFVSRDTVQLPNFFPKWNKESSTVSPSPWVSPGDLVCIDEAGRFWGSGLSLLPPHYDFFAEHRHFVDPSSGVSCDLVVIVQDISNLHRKLKALVELSFRAKKLKSLGLSKSYVIQMWEGSRQIERLVGRTENKNYKKEIYDLYHSYSGGVGTELVTDSRQNVLKSWKLWVFLGVAPLVLAFTVWRISSFFAPHHHIVPHAPAVSASPSHVVSRPSVSSSWRLAASGVLDGSRYVFLVGDHSRVRVLNGSSCLWFHGVAQSCSVSGSSVSSWSGPSPFSSSSSPSPLPR